MLHKMMIQVGSSDLQVSHICGTRSDKVGMLFPCPYFVDCKLIDSVDPDVGLPRLTC